MLLVVMYLYKFNMNLPFNEHVGVSVFVLKMSVGKCPLLCIWEA